MGDKLGDRRRLVRHLNVTGMPFLPWAYTLRALETGGNADYFPGTSGAKPHRQHPLLVVATARLLFEHFQVLNFAGATVGMAKDSEAEVTETQKYPCTN